MGIHESDCAVHNEPAYPKGKCDCGAEGGNMSKIEKVKKIIDENTHTIWERFGNIAATPIPECDVNTAAYQICQLFEQQPELEDINGIPLKSQFGHYNTHSAKTARIEEAKCDQCTFRKVALANDDCGEQDKEAV